MRYFIFFFACRHLGQQGLGHIPIISREGEFPNVDSVKELINGENVTLTNWKEMSENDFLNFIGYSSIEKFFNGDKDD